MRQILHDGVNADLVCLLDIPRQAPSSLTDESHDRDVGRLEAIRSCAEGNLRIASNVQKTSGALDRLWKSEKTSLINHWVFQQPLGPKSF